MRPSALHALIGKVLVPALPKRGSHTIRWRVLGFGSHDVRLKAIHSGKPSSTPIDEIERDILAGYLRVEDK